MVRLCLIKSSSLMFHVKLHLFELGYVQFVQGYLGEFVLFSLMVFLYFFRLRCIAIKLHHKVDLKKRCVYIHVSVHTLGGAKPSICNFYKKKKKSSNSKITFINIYYSSVCVCIED